MEQPDFNKAEPVHLKRLISQKSRHWGKGKSGKSSKAGCAFVDFPCDWLNSHHCPGQGQRWKRKERKGQGQRQKDVAFLDAFKTASGTLVPYFVESFLSFESLSMLYRSVPAALFPASRTTDN